MTDPTPPDPGPPATTPDGTARPRKRKRVRRRITDNDPEVRRAKLVARLTNPSMWMWVAYAMVGLGLMVFLLVRSIGRVPGAPG
ncbi:MAG: hypothetical protein U0871_23655 [Gemmataceae bacterium]